jgi:SAM-dependent methyltransferase
VFRNPAQHLSDAEQLARYKEHRNALDDPAYLRFLSRLADPVAARLQPGASGLDFGCGPVPALAHLMESQGFPTASYDPHFRPDAEPLRRTYQFVTCSEVLEHIARPREALERMASLLEPAGLLGIMTQFRNAALPYERWWYRRDPTHVCFYSEATMHWIARRFGWTAELAGTGTGVVLFRMPAVEPLASPA